MNVAQKSKIKNKFAQKNLIQLYLMLEKGDLEMKNANLNFVAETEYFPQFTQCPCLTHWLVLSFASLGHMDHSTQSTLDVNEGSCL